MAIQEFQLTLKEVYGNYYMYVSEGQEGYRDINGLYVLKNILENVPPEKILVTMRWNEDNRQTSDSAH